MGDDFISKKDRIIVAAIEIINDSGLSSLTTKTLAFRENVNEAFIYKCFGGVDEVLKEVVEYFIKFDKTIMMTIQVKDKSNKEKIRDFFDTYTTYYENYTEISSIILNYEELLHNIQTRQNITNCICERERFLTELISQAMKNEEINSSFTVEELVDLLTGVLMNQLISRRVKFHNKGLREEVMSRVDKILEQIAI